MDWFDVALKVAAPALGAIGFFSALYWQQRQIIIELRERKQQDKEQAEKIHTLELKVVKLESDHNGSWAMLEQKLDMLKDMVDVVGKRIHSMEAGRNP